MHVAGNIWNKRSRTADKGWSSSLGVGVLLVMKDHKKRRTWTDSLDKRPKRKKIG
jgi:hypothetical protein